LFDLDGTLFDRDGSIRPLLEHQYDCFSSELKPVARDVFVDRVIALDAHGYLEKSAVYSQIVADFGLRETLADSLAEHFRDYYTAFARPFAGVASTLRQLNGAGFKLGIVTNGMDRIQSSVIDALNINEHLSAITISESAGIRKPDPRIFQATARAIGMQVGECCFVGDHPEVDVVGALSAEMSAIWKRTSYWSEPGVDVPTINEFPELLTLLMA
jgi:putative hydrolase of the HAD superfamily